MTKSPAKPPPESGAKPTRSVTRPFFRPDGDQMHLQSHCLKRSENNIPSHPAYLQARRQTYFTFLRSTPIPELKVVRSTIHHTQCAARTDGKDGRARERAERAARNGSGGRGGASKRCEKQRTRETPCLWSEAHHITNPLHVERGSTICKMISPSNQTHWRPHEASGTRAPAFACKENPIPQARAHHKVTLACMNLCLATRL